MRWLTRMWERARRELSGTAVWVFSAGVSSGSELTKGSFAAKLLLEVEVEAIFEYANEVARTVIERCMAQRLKRNKKVGKRILKHEIYFNGLLSSFFQSAL